MAKYYIKNYSKDRQSFLSSINSINETKGNIEEPYTITLKKVTWWGGVKEVTIKVVLPRGFNHVKELTVGREWAT